MLNTVLDTTHLSRGDQLWRIQTCTEKGWWVYQLKHVECGDALKEEQRKTIEKIHQLASKIYAWGTTLQGRQHQWKLAAFYFYSTTAREADSMEKDYGH